MAPSPEEIDAVTKALSGIGVKEETLISNLGKWNLDDMSSFREGCDRFFAKDDRGFHKWFASFIEATEREFLRFKRAVVLWTMHPWERDAHLANEALQHGQTWYGVLVEIACTRSSDELLGTRKAYHSLFEKSIEEDVASCIQTSERKLLVALVSSYRYEGSRVEEATAKSEAKSLRNAIKSAGVAIENDEVVRILATRSKPRLKAIFKHYNDIEKKSIEEDLQAYPILQATVQCLCAPEKYFIKALDKALNNGNAAEDLTRVIVTRACTEDMKEIKKEYLEQNKDIPLSQKIKERTLGNYQSFLLRLVDK
ncbi:annexin D4-like [Malania oleifera]|uniref:annexin D4-like n=1 Tax=Malania oleifera TaxID=397392 RepID=UPI0025AEC4D5|nr:annexin D4-like [Malania oleifera]